MGSLTIAANDSTDPDWELLTERLDKTGVVGMDRKVPFTKEKLG